MKSEERRMKSEKRGKKEEGEGWGRKDEGGRNESRVTSCGLRVAGYEKQEARGERREAGYELRPRRAREISNPKS
jgi:hypothetical protein